MVSESGTAIGPNCTSTYSYLSATMGSTRIACRAGAQVAPADVDPLSRRGARWTGRTPNQSPKVAMYLRIRRISFRVVPELRATRQLTLGKIDSRLGGPRTDAKAAPEEETSNHAKDSVAVTRSGSGKILSSKQPYVCRCPARIYRHAIDEFVEWYCSEPRLSFNRTVVLRYRMHLEARKLAPGTINLRLGAIRRLAYEASDCGLLSADLAAGIRRVKGVKKIGVRLGNWLLADQAITLLEAPNPGTMKGKRDLALLAILVACGFATA